MKTQEAIALSIQRASLQELDETATLFDLYRQFYSKPSDIATALSYLRSRLSANESIIFLAYSDSQPVGFVQLYPLFSSLAMAKQWVLNDLFVLPKARGRGIGTALLRHVETFGRETNAKAVLLETAPENEIAKRLYLKNGYLPNTDVLHFSLSL